MAPPRSLQALLSRSIDYAGIFPPAKLELAPALENYAGYLRAPEAWMLSGFVLPAGRFGDAAINLGLFDSDHRLRVSALGSKAESASGFVEQVKQAMSTVRRFRGEHPDQVSIEQFEMPLGGPIEDVDLSALDEILAGSDLRAFWEAPVQQALDVIARLAGAKIGAFGYKLRTGGVTADAFPTSGEIAVALVSAARHNFPIKFTAGLHHPVRMFREEVNARMHGFLNVLGAAVLAFEHGWSEEQAAAMLEDEDAHAFSFDDEKFVWRDWRIKTERIEVHRKLVTSFGSCSFDEPRQDLRVLNFL